MKDGIGAATPMQVTNIDIFDLHFTGEAKGYRGSVSMELRPTRDGVPMHVQFLCHAAQPRDCPSAIVIRELVSDALRQAHRMPGFRRAERQIKVDISRARISARLSLTGAP